MTALFMRQLAPDISELLEGLEQRRLLRSFWPAQDEREERLTRLQTEVANELARYQLAGQQPPLYTVPLNLLDWIITQLDRPGGAIRGLVSRALESRGQTREALAGLIEGFLKPKEYSTERLIEQLGLDHLRGVPRFALSMGLGMLLDPTTYGFGITQGLRAGAKGLTRAITAQAKRRLTKDAGLLQRLLTQSARATVRTATAVENAIADVLGPIFSMRYIRSPFRKGKTGEVFKEAVEQIFERAEEVKGSIPSAIAQQRRTIVEPATQALREMMEGAPRRAVAEAERKFWNIWVAAHVEAPQFKKEMVELMEVVTSDLGKFVNRLKEGIPVWKALPGPLKRMAKSLGMNLEEAFVDFTPSRSVIRTAAQSLKHITDKIWDAYLWGPERPPENIASLVRSTASAVRELLDHIYKQYGKLGLMINYRPGYLPHRWARPIAEIADRLDRYREARVPFRTLRGKIVYGRVPAQMERTIEMTIRELAETKGLPPVVTDVRVLMAVAEGELIRHRATVNMVRGLNTIAKQAGFEKGLVRLSADGAQITIREGLPFASELQRFLRMYEVATNTEPGLRSVWSAWNAAQNIWKGVVTAPNIDFHIRNTFGNFFNNFLGGLWDPRWYYWAAKGQSGAEKITKIAGKTVNLQELYDDFVRDGLKGFGAVRGELGYGLVRIAQEAYAPGPLQQLARGHAVLAGRQIGDWLETNAKFAQYLFQRVGLGKSREEAKRIVKMLLFDYSELTPAEHAIRQIVPFYTWIRKNTQLQLSKLFEDPRKFLAMERMWAAALEAKGMKPEEVPEWLREARGIPIGESPEKVVRWFNPQLPYADIARYYPTSLTRLAGELMQVISPFIRVPAEIASGVSVVTGKPLERYRGELKPLFGAFGPAVIPARLEPVVRAMRPIQNIRSMYGAVRAQLEEQGLQPQAASEAAKMIVLRVILGSLVKEVPRETAQIEWLRGLLETLRGRRYALTEGRTWPLEEPVVFPELR